jgi:hypothetical protein
MAFTLEDGTGVIGANAYVDVAFVTAYLTDRNRETENGWDAAAAGATQAAIIAATDYIERVFGPRFLGNRASAPEAQGLGFPRVGIVKDGFQLVSTTLPVGLQQATAEYAVRALAAILQPDPTIDATGKAVTRKREKVGPIEEETEYEAGGSITNLVKPYPAADALLTGLIRPTSGVIRG